MTVALLPPVSSGGGDWRGQLPINAARRYVRGPRNSRWHRPRSGSMYPAGYVCLDLWCGQGMRDSPELDQLLYVDELPPDQPACGTCVGRALGAGQDDVPADLPPLRFDPRWITPPSNCPGSRSRTMWEPLPNAHWNVGRCLVCGDVVSVRAVGRGYDAWGAGPVYHAPGAGLVGPCPFHAWNRLVAKDGQVVCGCGWPYELLPSPSPVGADGEAG
jgi:hypothetical protein